MSKEEQCKISYDFLAEIAAKNGRMMCRYEDYRREYYAERGWKLTKKGGRK